MTRCVASPKSRPRTAIFANSETKPWPTGRTTELGRMISGERRNLQWGCEAQLDGAALWGSDGSWVEAEGC